MTAAPPRGEGNPSARDTLGRSAPPSDDPRVQLEEDAGIFEPVPPYPPRTEREAEFYTLGDGENVVDLDPVLGYLHRGVEKLCEN
ncbi:MAG TPA: hypothetical protein VGO64_01060, partial [Candidatus Limnocylindrales bacterium]|nr:hypothetical protein [Candidatus Limnocylindrales bacterium]